MATISRHHWKQYSLVYVANVYYESAKIPQNNYYVMSSVLQKGIKDLAFIKYQHGLLSLRGLAKETAKQVRYVIFAHWLRINCNCAFLCALPPQSHKLRLPLQLTKIKYY